MGDDFHIELSIPTDDDGYILLKCSHCGTFFKATPFDIKDDALLSLYCPSCSLTSDNYLPDDVIELAMAKAKNAAMKMIYDEFKKAEKQFSKGPLTITAGKRPTPEPENPIRSGIEALEIVSFPCCNRKAKIKPMLKMTGCYCPFCGVKNYEFE